MCVRGVSWDVDSRRDAGNERAVSPVVGVVLLVGIVVLLAALGAVVFLDLAQEREPSPDVTLSLESTGTPGRMLLVHEGGDVLDGDRVTLQGAADGDAMAGTRFGASDGHELLATSETVEVVWRGENGATYVLWEFDVDASTVVPPPDEGCSWVDTETNGGTEDATVSGIVVGCTVQTDKVVTVNSGGVVVGDTASDTKTLDLDGATLYGDATAEKGVNAQDSTVSGGVESRTENVKIDNTSVGGSVAAEKTAEVIAGATVEGDVTSDGTLVKVDDGVVGGAVATAGTVKLTDATVEGEVYAGDLDCTGTNSTVAGQDCGDYDPRDPGDY